MNKELTKEEKRIVNQLTVIMVVVNVIYFVLKVYFNTPFIDVCYLLFLMKFCWGLVRYSQFQEKNNGKHCFKTLYALLFYRWF